MFNLVVGKPQSYHPTVSTVFVILGYLDEYWGRQLIDVGDKIEHFYPEEVAAANSFERLLNVLRDERRLTTNIERRIDSQGHITFYSQEITALVDSYYELYYDGQTYGLANGKPQRFAFLSYQVFKTLSSVRLESGDYDERFSYLLGAYQRYGTDTTMRFANATPKAELVARLLREVSCEYVAWKFWQKGAPFINEIEFEPTDDLIDFFGLQRDKDS